MNQHRRGVDRLRLGGSLLALLLLATGCTGPDPGSGAPPGTDDGTTTTAFADCADLTTPIAAPTTSTVAPTTSTGTSTGPTGASTGSTGASTAPASMPTGPAGTPTGSAGRPPSASTPAAEAGSAGGVGRPLPALSLPCFVGTGEVAVGELRGPAVLNLWASWCAPCRRELPAFQRLAERTGDRLRVVGVNTGDARPAARSIGEDFGLEFPSLYDRDKLLLTGLGGRPVLPVTLLVDAEGRIRHRDETGALDDTELATLVRRHLGVAVPS
ncbi:redoxin domain-containing protein [Micromonospora sp. WMMD1102]|uniref:TlpA family protein disulfide reductase n=1 Tax=Micromonospora sp. WMMD1102 TaxID=3016105 RepID=UPI00241579D2|nr:redoxin domain-containing protein [Micromonospora sp. WMMD1102]MDG4791288.1 redoxin domain-containing protein [Micromonospora sp. WMMD1102]